MQSLSIVIPVYNSERTIGPLCQAIMGLYAGAYRLDIILVNDGSRDDSDAVCRRLHAEHPDRIAYIKLARNFGEHNAVMAGLHHATGDFCVIMDDDFQNPPGEVARLVREMGKGYDVVYASYAVKNDGFFRNLGSRLHNRMADIVLKKPVGLYLSSFKILNRFLVREIVGYTGPTPYLDAIVLRSTQNIGVIQLEHGKRAASESGYTLRKLFTLWGNMIFSFSLVPLRIIGLVGFCVTLFGLVYGGIKAFDQTGLPMALSNYETLMSANLVFRGLVLMAMSIVGEYIGRIYQSLAKEPQFVVRERLMPRPANDDQIAYLQDFRGSNARKDQNRTS